ncbi:MAG: DNA gyrase subunit A [Bacilli bacterium]|nr:DNA gyrase subunit A [Bacilli bacterium]
MADEKKDILENEEVINPEEEAELEQIEEGIVPGLRDTDLSSEVRGSFLDYAMSVIVSRAIPDVRDGCKPVHRRVIFGMNESGMTPSSPYKKCARIVGDVMGKYHPHGDAAIYSTLVRLAQPFNMKHTLVDGHGNFGSVDGDEAAAMRYTEARMSKIAMEMVRDIKCDVVDFVDNYDGTEKEPSVLPSRFPNLLVNGSSGIAVGMATNIPTHNLGECIDAVVALAKNPTLTPVELMTNYLYGPDFPTGAIILGRQGIKDYFETGTGSIQIRSKCEIHVNERTGKKQIIVSEIPYQVNKALMIENMAHLVRDKVIEGISDIRDESNKEGVRVVIDVKHDFIPEVILNKLYKLTPLQSSFGVIMLCLVDGAPKILPMNEVLLHYLNFQVDVIERRTKYLLKQDADRCHIVVGLLNAIANIDDIVDIIKAAATPEEATNNLMAKYGFSEVQTQAILAMTLRRLTGLEEGKLEEEKATLEANIAEYNRILSSRENEIEVVIKELEEIKAKFGEERVTEISDASLDIDDEDLIPEEDIVIALTSNNYVKRMTSDTFRTQNRGGRGVRGMSTNEDDEIATMVHTKTHTDVLFFSSLGKVYRIRGYMVPEAGRNAKGIPAQNLLDLERGERIITIISLDEYNPENYLFFVTKNGLVKRTVLSEYESIRKNGKIAIELRDGDQLLDVKRTSGDEIICLASQKGKLVKFNEQDVRPMGRTATGVKGMDTEVPVISATSSSEGNLILVITNKGFGKLSPMDDYRLTSRGSKGVLTLNETAKNGKLVAMKAVKGDEDLMVVTANGIVIRMPLSQIKVSGRNTQGVRVIRLEDKQRVSNITIVPHDDEAVEEAPAEETATEAAEPVENTEVKE